MNTLWVIWSMEHNAYWGHNRCGYVNGYARAGRYSFTEALEIVSTANVDKDNPQEAMICTHESYKH